MEQLRYQHQCAKAFQKEVLKGILPLTIVIFTLVIVFLSIFLSMNPGIATRLLFQSSTQISDSINFIGFLPKVLEDLYTGLYLIALGVIPFLFIPLLFTIFNGSIIGILLGSTSISTITPGILAVYLLPHGIVLIPAVILASAYGIYLCKSVSQHVMGKKKIESFKLLFLQMLRAYLFKIVPLMILAAILEVFITPLMISLL